MNFDEPVYFQFSTFLLDKAGRKLLRDSEVVSIPYKAIEILSYLIINRERVVTKSELLEQFWDETHVSEKNLVQQLCKIRKALGDSADGSLFIETFPKVGYQFVEEVFVLVEQTPVDMTKSKAFEIREQPAELSDIDSPGSSDFLFGQEHVWSLGRSKRMSNISASALCIFSLAILFAFIGSLYFYSDKTSEPKAARSIAVIPFLQIGKVGNQNLGLGIADTLVSKLGNQTALSVSPTSSIIEFANLAKPDPIEIGRELRVDGVIIGTLQNEAEMVRVNIQFVDVNSGKAIWAENFRKGFSSIFDLQDEIAMVVSRRLFSEAGSGSCTGRTPTNPVGTCT